MSRAEAAWVSVMNLWEENPVEVVVRVEVRTADPVLFSDGVERLRAVQVSGGAARVVGEPPALEGDARFLVASAFVDALDGAAKEALRVFAPAHVLAEVDV